MNTYFFFAGILCFVLGLVHSILGEYLIFLRKRNKGCLVPTKVQSDLKEGHLRIIWATWHLASVFGWCIGVILLKIATDPGEMNSGLGAVIIQSAIYSMALGAALVLIGTKGRHPGWIVLLLIALLLWMGS